MPELVCEIWRDDDNGSTSAEQVSEHHDRVRNSVSPNSTLLHTYTARSSFELFQKNNDWHGWGKWTAPPGVPEHFFTEEEAEEQRRYLAARIVP